MKNRLILLCLLLAMVSYPLSAQKKKTSLQPGKMYAAGETLQAPRLGFSATVPQGWEGILPRESEVFLLSSTTNTYGEIFVFGNEHGDLTTIKSNWANGVELSETIRIKAINPMVENDIVSSEITAEGEYINNGNKGFVMARCSAHGPCVTTLMIAPSQFYESVKNTVSDFMRNSSFAAPSNANLYQNFNWQEFLSNKVVMNYASAEGGSKETMIHLCPDGSFTANFKKKGFFKEQNPAYKGNMKGQWSVRGDGEKATIQFIFNKKKLSPVEKTLQINDEKIISDGERYFVGNSDQCK